MSYSQWIRRYRRTIGIPLVIGALLLAKFDGRFALVSTILICGGEAIRIWSAGHLRKEEILTTGGPYRAVRNPLYIGSFLIAIGFAAIAGSLWIWLMVLAYFILCYIPVVRFEENILREKFPNHFPRYAKEVPAFVPSLHLFRSNSTHFSWKQVMRNKEYNAVLGILIGYAYLLFIRSHGPLFTS